MFIMDVPYVPAQETPIMLAQAAGPGAGATQLPDYILNYCKETESTGDPRSAMRAVEPAFMLTNYLESHDKTGSLRIDLAAIKTTLLKDTTHGKITSVIDNTGRPWYRYDPEPEYIGNDQAVFMAEYQGKRYKIVVDLHVFIVVSENDPTATSCPPPQLIKVNGKPVSGSTSYDSGYSLNSISVTVADLPNATVGQTTSSTITFDPPRRQIGY